MESFFERVSEINGVINDFVWTKIGLVLLIGTGILLTCATKFFQLSHIKLWLSETIGSLFSKDVISHTKDKASISPFQALCTALAATIGTGNIAGVAAAIVTGGAGAVFWMWFAAFFGMMTNFSENVLGIYFRRKNANGEWSGGAMYYLQDGLGGYKNMKKPGRFLGILFSIFAVLASFGIGNMGQVNKIVANVEAAFPIKALSFTLYGGVTVYTVLIGVVIMLLAGAIILGGLKRIAAFAEKVVPFMVLLFVIGSLIVIGAHYDHIGSAFHDIFVNAFSLKAIGGGTLGTLISRVVTAGFKRGVFSNEAGLGSSVMVHSNSSVREPVKQGMWGIFEVFMDTFIVCTMTALVILTSGVYKPGEQMNDATMMGEAFNTVFSFGGIGAKFVAIAMFLFAFTTVLGWSHYGTKSWEYLFGTRSTVGYKTVFVLMLISGALMTSSLAWDISDTFNALMMVPNLIGVLALTPLVARITKNYVDRKVRRKDLSPLLSFDSELNREAAENKN